MSNILRSKMSKEQLADHNEEVCTMIMKENRVRIKDNHAIKKKISKLRQELKDSNDAFKTKKADICSDEGVSEKFMTTIIFGKLGLEEEEARDEKDLIKLLKNSLYE